MPDATQQLVDLLKAAITGPRLAMRPREMAQAIGISERCLFGWRAKGFPTATIDGVILHPVAECAAWLSKQIQTPATNDEAPALKAAG